MQDFQVVACPSCRKRFRISKTSLPKSGICSQCKVKFDFASSIVDLRPTSYKSKSGGAGTPSRNVIVETTNSEAPLRRRRNFSLMIGGFISTALLVGGIVFAAIWMMSSPGGEGDLETAKSAETTGGREEADSEENRVRIPAIVDQPRDIEPVLAAGSNTWGSSDELAVGSKKSAPKYHIWPATEMLKNASNDSVELFYFWRLRDGAPGIGKDETVSLVTVAWGKDGDIIGASEYLANLFSDPNTSVDRREGVIAVTLSKSGPMQKGLTAGTVEKISATLVGEGLYNPTTISNTISIWQDLKPTQGNGSSDQGENGVRWPTVDGRAIP